MAQYSASKFPSSLSKMRVRFGAARVRIISDRPVMIPLKEPTSLLELGCRPTDAFEGLRTIVH